MEQEPKDNEGSKDVAEQIKEVQKRLDRIRDRVHQYAEMEDADGRPIEDSPSYHSNLMRNLGATWREIDEVSKSLEILIKT